MVRLLKHNQIDFEKWDACANRTPQQMVYAYSWYLNLTTNNQWDGLVWNDYETIMPLPWNKKLLRKQIYMPTYVQQLGPFGNLEIIKKKEIFKILDKKYIQYTLCTTIPLNKKAIPRSNFTLLLPENYKKTIYNNYRKNRKYDSRQNHKFKFKELSVPDFIAFYSEISNHLINTSGEKFKEFLDKCMSMNKFKLFGAFREQKLCSAIMLSDYNKRLTLLLSATIKDQKLNANAILLNEIFKEYSGQGYIFDFEGSEIEGVANYFKSFGSTENQYFKSEKKNKVYKMLKK